MKKFIKACKMLKRSRCCMMLEDYRNSIKIGVDMIQTNTL